LIMRSSIGSLRTSKMLSRCRYQHPAETVNPRAVIAIFFLVASRPSSFFFRLWFSSGFGFFQIPLQLRATAAWAAQNEIVRFLGSKVNYAL
jgi:hypothetical protein